MSEYRVEQSDDGWYVMRRGGCWASCSSPHDAERIARALAVLDAMEQEQATRVDPLTGLPPDGPKCRRHGVYKLAVAHYYCKECAKEGRATVGPASVAAEAGPVDVQAIAAVAWECVKRCKDYQPPPVMCPAHQEQAKRIARGEG